MNFYEPRMRELNAVLNGYIHGLLPVHVTEPQMQEAERLLGARLPEDYREFIRDFGNFDLPWMDFPVKPNSNLINSGNIAVFHGIVFEGQSRNYNLINDYFYVIENDEVWPKEWIPIGSFESYSVAMDIKGATRGSIYYIQNFNPVFVAYSFDEFIQLLHPHFTDPVETEYSAKEAAEFWATFSTE